ncbi:MAG: S-formylglutathione hydrolase [Deltaproteobacteria bacterium]
MADLELVSSEEMFGGEQKYLRHLSDETGTQMTFSVFVPPQAKAGPVPVLYWLSGLTCTPENFTVKAGAQQYAAEHGILLVAPDTSPREAGIAGEEDSWDLGSGASFYLDATEMPWIMNYRMHSYLMDELPALVAEGLPGDTTRSSIFGHSMGGHGALVLALRNPGRFRSVSAFAPICAPSHCPWGEKAFTAYLGCDRAAWAEWDACALIAGATERLPLLIDQGEDDEFLAEQLHPERLEAACSAAGHPLTLRRHAGFGHGYDFIQTQIGDHIRHHAEALLG